MLETPNDNSKKLTYIECSKPGLHYGQVCNMICMQPKCIDDPLCCCVCIQQSHKKHETKPLKTIVKEVNQQTQSIKPSNYNMKNISSIIDTNKKNTIELFDNIKKQLNTSLDSIQNLLKNSFTEQSQQIQLKNSNPVTHLQSTLSSLIQAKTTDQLRSLITTLITLIQTKQKDPIYNSQILQPQLINNLTFNNKQLNRIINITLTQSTKKTKQCQKQLQQCLLKRNLWKNIQFKFSTIYKHTDIKLLTDYYAKSQNTSGYKFAILQPNVQTQSKKIFHFQIKQCTSNWIAVGICHKNIVVSKAYAFNFSTLGHGAYMISANGGIWSNTNNQFNNKIKAFKFAKGDVISVMVKFAEKIITFKKKQEIFNIGFSTITDDKLHPCVLFYYVNDEVECLTEYKDFKE